MRVSFADDQPTQAKERGGSKVLTVGLAILVSSQQPGKGVIVILTTRQALPSSQYGNRVSNELNKQVIFISIAIQAQQNTMPNKPAEAKSAPIPQPLQPNPTRLKPSLKPNSNLKPNQTSLSRGVAMDTTERALGPIRVGAFRELLNHIIINLCSRG